MPQLYDNPGVEELHLKAMRALAAETGHEFLFVKQIYEIELAKLQAAAHVTDFMVLLSARRARETLRTLERSIRSQALPA